MKQSFFTLAILSLMFAISCQNQDNQTDKIILSGEISHINSDSLCIYNPETREMEVIMKLDKNNHFQDTLELNDGFYILYDGTKSFPSYLKKGFNLTLKLDASEDGKSTFTGKGAKENQYLSDVQFDLEPKLKEVKHYSYYCPLNETDFLKLNDSIYQVSIDFLNQHKNELDKDFYLIREASLKYDKLNRIFYYETYNRDYFKKNDNFKVSENYPNPFEKIDFNEKLLSVQSYISFLQNYIEYLPYESGKDIEIQQLENINKNIQNKAIKEKIAIVFSEPVLDRTGELKQAYELLKTMITNPKDFEKVQATYDALKKVAKGEISPSFKLKDINGKEVTLESLRGSLVFIDVWATWCGPCRGEIPSLLKLEKEMEHKNIKFVSICVWDQENKWREMVKKEQLGGIQLFASRSQLDFVNAYQIKGIPRFIIIDKEGRIVDNNAKRPSNPELKKELNSLL